MTALHSLETLTTQQTALFYAEGTPTEAREESRLMDAAIACGMAWDHDDLHGWVAERVGEFLLSGPSGDECDDVEGIGQDEFGQWEYV